MALLLLLVAFVFGIIAAWQLGAGWGGADTPGGQVALYLQVIALAVVPYVIAACFAHIAALRQRQVSIELIARIGAMLSENEVAKAKLASDVRAATATPAARATAPAPDATKAVPGQPAGGTGPIITE